MTSGIEAVAGLIRHRINDLDKNYMGVLVGQTGSGKSAGAISLCEHVDPSFKGNPRIVFTPDEFLKQIQIMKPGQAIVFDEAGVGIPAREWMRVQNRLIGYTAQLFRHLNLCVIFTVPSMSFIDKQLRNLMHAVVEMRTIDFKNNVSVAKYWKITHNAVFNNTNLEPLILFSGGSHTTIDPLYIPFPSDEVWPQYIKMKEEYAAQFYKETVDELQGEKSQSTGITKRDLIYPPAARLIDEHKFSVQAACDVMGMSKRYYYDCKNDLDAGGSAVSE